MRYTAALLKAKNKGNQGLSVWLREGLFKDLRAKREALQGKWKIQVGSKKTREKIRPEKECQDGRDSVNSVLSQLKEGDEVGELSLK